MLEPETTRLLRALVTSRTVAALATLHDGRPSASMIPYALHRANRDDSQHHRSARHGSRPNGGDARDPLVIVSHVSRLSAHTRDMLSDPDVCLLITGPDPADGGGGMPQAVPRIAIHARARFVDRDAPDHEALRNAYLTRFPDTAELFGFADFSLVAFDPTTSRLVAGFARAHSLSAEQLSAAVFAD
ncbi:MAG: pyridoxamine 5'-phosphate oxidase family protein [Planctomycetaceae bacterium]